MAPHRKKIILRHGKGVALARDVGVSVQTVSKALRWESDSDIQNLIRKRAKDLGYINDKNSAKFQFENLP